MAPQIEEDRLFDLAAADWNLPNLNEAARIDQQWRRSFVAVRIADILARLETDTKFLKLDVRDRAWLRGQVESLVDEVSDYFNKPPSDDGSQYEAHKEYDPSEVGQ